MFATAAIAASGVRSPGEVRALPARTVTYSAPVYAQLREMKGFLRENLYRHWQVERQVEQATRVTEGLFRAFVARPSMLPPRPRARAGRGARVGRGVGRPRRRLERWRCCACVGR